MDSWVFRGFGVDLELISDISTTDIVLAVIFLCIGIALGRVIWGAQRTYVMELEDTVALMRSRDRNVVEQDRSPVTFKPTVLSKEDVRLECPAQDHQKSCSSGELSQINYQRLHELSDELGKIRVLISGQDTGVDVLKEHLDQSDHSMKKANGRLQVLLRALEKGE